MELYCVWWPWLTSKSVARVCQHQLSFVFINVSSSVLTVILYIYILPCTFICSLHYSVFHRARDETVFVVVKISRVCVWWLNVSSRWITVPLTRAFSTPAFYRIEFSTPVFSVAPYHRCKNRFYVFYSGHVFLRFLGFFILPTFFIFKNVHWKYHLKSLSKQRKKNRLCMIVFLCVHVRISLYRPIYWQALLLTYL